MYNCFILWSNFFTMYCELIIVIIHKYMKRCTRSIIQWIEHDKQEIKELKRNNSYTYYTSSISLSSFFSYSSSLLLEFCKSCISWSISPSPTLIPELMSISSRPSTSISSLATIRTCWKQSCIITHATVYMSMRVCMW